MKPFTSPEEAETNPTCGSCVKPASQPRHHEPISIQTQLLKYGHPCDGSGFQELRDSISPRAWLESGVKKKWQKSSGGYKVRLFGQREGGLNPNGTVFSKKQKKNKKTLTHYPLDKD